jgi:hypothetical protein
MRKHVIVFAAIVSVCVAMVRLAVVAHAHDDDKPPSSGQVVFAQQVSDLMLNELVAALFKEFDETTAANVAHGKQAISLIFNDHNRDMRLVGAFGPLLGGSNDHPADKFEKTALKRALGGDPITSVETINDRWYYRRSVPLSNAMHQNCVLCHTNFTPDLFQNNPEQWVGALMLSVPIR